jgi:hypothetical protein
MKTQWPDTLDTYFADDSLTKDTSARFGAGSWKSWMLLGWLLCAWATRAPAQNFSITPPILSNGTVVIGFPTRSDSYYLLEASPTLFNPLAPANAMLGNGSNLAFAPLLNPIGSMFYQVEQLSLTSTNDILGDGIADGFKLQHGLPVFGPSGATLVPLGDTRTWLQIYQWQTNLAALPLAYFPTPSATVLVGSSNVTVPVSFTKPFTGRFYYQLSGTAIASSPGVTGDYVQPAGSVFVNNGTTANITIALVPEPDIEINRSIVIALSTLTNQTYTVTTNSCIAAVQIVQSTFGVFVGSLTMTNGLFTGAQAVKMAFRPGAGGGTIALLDVTGNALLGNTFSAPVNAGPDGFQLNGSQFSNLLTNTPWSRNLSVELSFGATQTNGTTFTTPVTISLAGLTASGLSYSGSGILNLAQSQ